jgi:hypothetical protein
MEFFLGGLARRGVPPNTVKEALDLMDHVDSERNGILKQLNALLRQGHSKVLPYITLSTAQQKLSSELEESEGEGRQRWDDHYLRTHRGLRAFLDQAESKSAASESVGKRPPNNPLQRPRPRRARR